MICQECHKEKGCGCVFLSTNKRDYKVCPDCKKKLDTVTQTSQIDEPKPTTPNVQGV